MIFEWQTNQWERFLRLTRKLPHAILLHGPRGVGKFEFAKSAAALLLCGRAAEGADLREACGECKPCLLQAQGNNPDFFLLQPEADTADANEADPDHAATPAAEKKKKPSKQIKIDQIRDLLENIQTGTHQGGRRVILLAPAEAMNPATANALLKTLEEPPPDTVMLLVSSAPERLLPTIRSRCQYLDFGEPDQAHALNWLKENEINDASELLARYGGAPLSALEAAGEESGLDHHAFIEYLAVGRDPLACAEFLVGVEPVTAVDWMQRWVSDLVMFGLAGRTRYFPGFEAAIRKIASSAAMISLLGFSRRLTELRAIAQYPVNPRLFIERLAMDYTEASRPSP
jgi:DNA polymerase-3 subunit delta'